MKRQFKNPLSPLQQKKLTRVVLVLFMLAICWLLFAPNMGVVSLQRENSRLDALIQQKSQLEQENAELRQEITKIKDDIDHFERLAREKHGLLRKNEILFDFDEQKKKNN